METPSPDQQPDSQEETPLQPIKQEAPEVDARGIRSLERLRQRVVQATREIARLREENAALAERLAQTEPDRTSGGTLLELDDDPEALREKITGFIETIDRYLEDHTPRPD